MTHHCYAEVSSPFLLSVVSVKLQVARVMFVDLLERPKGLLGKMNMTIGLFTLQDIIDQLQGAATALIDRKSLDCVFVSRKAVRCF